MVLPPREALRPRVDRGEVDDRDPLHKASVGLDRWPWLRAVIACAFVVVWVACLIWDWFIRADAVLPGWFQALGVVVLGYLLGIDLVTSFFRGRRGG